MKNIGLSAIVAGLLSVAVIGLAGSAQADDNGQHGAGTHHGYYYGDRSNNPWLNQLYPTVKVPHVDTSVHN